MYRVSIGDKMGRPLKYGEDTKSVTLRIPVYLHKRMKQEGLDLGSFIVPLLENRYTQTVEKTVITNPSGEDDTAIMWLAEHWKMLQRHLDIDFGPREEHTFPAYPPESRQQLQWIYRDSHGKILVTKGWLRRHYGRIYNRARDLGNLINRRLLQ